LHLCGSGDFALDLNQIRLRNLPEINAMRPFLYRCPATGLSVQSFVADAAPDDDAANGESYESVTCIACKLTHLVNPKSGKVLGADSD